MTDVKLHVEGRVYEGWTSVDITRGLEQVADSFRVELTERWRHTEEPWPLDPGQTARLDLGNRTAVTGYINDVRVSYNSDRKKMTISGRSFTGDLVDCTAVPEPGEWRDKTMLKIAKSITSHFGIKVVTEVEEPEPIRRFGLQEGETAFEALQRLAKLRGVLLSCTQHGELLITRAGRQGLASQLRSGDNILTGSVYRSERDRFSRYVIKAQMKGGDDWFGDDAAAVFAEAEDSNVKRFRPRVDTSGTQMSKSQALQRAKYTRNRRAGRSERLSYSVASWVVNSSGVLWEPGMLIRVDDDLLNVKADTLLSTVTFTRDDRRGTRADLELVRPEALSVLELPVKEGTAW